MTINVYLPDELGERAKAAGVNFSAMLRGAVETELQRRDKVAAALEGATEHELELKHPETEVEYTGVITGTVIAHDDFNTAYLTEDRRVIVHEHPLDDYTELSDPERQLSEFFEGPTLASVLTALGYKPRVRL